MTFARPAALLTLTLACGASSAADVMIYRCTDAQGRLTLRDTPCRAGDRQQVRPMVRPTDPPPRARPTVAPTSTPATVAPERTRIVVVTAPRPLYECVTPEGDRYTSESADGRPRWVPLWTLGVAPWSGYPSGYAHRAHGGVYGRIEGRVGNGSHYELRAGGRAVEPPLRPPLQPPHNPGPGGPPLGVGVVAVPAGTWVRDACHPLPQSEVCARLRDERYALDRRYHSALQSERVRITTEQRGIDARLASDCGGS
ncbi:DUF4124 domain-containing protein [Cognatilysobacter bugurensis]|uniref:DUF4124 domain-containing protein n=1 Tax=Cognatilysobacter bugurensis TaxID=543356 RepID=A0A918T2N5_9GAMM|nr:DUF4124 domain-containing protein [Lysobacter bugurensis]GHA82565.1 hypothetical protein GCM10007067_20680 [Lysobacter bugurensis]